MSTIIPNMGYIFPLIVMSICFGYWTWVLTGKVNKWHPFQTRIGRGISVFIVMMAIWSSSPLYVDYLRYQDTTGLYVDDSKEVIVHFGSRENDWFYSKTTVGELKDQPNVPFGINGMNIFTLHIRDNTLYIDTKLFAGIADYQKHIFSPPVVIKDDGYKGVPDNWKVYQNKENLEIVNQDGIPVLIMERKKPYEITISGLFVTPMGICKVNNETGIFMLGDTLSELGNYTVDRTFIHSPLDIFITERTYILHD